MGKKRLIVVHLLYWLYFYFITEYLNKLAYQGKIVTLRQFTSPLALTNYLIFTSIFYFNYCIVIPRLLKQKKYVITLLAWMILIALFILVRFYLQENLLRKYFGICNFCDVTFPVYIVNNLFQCLYGIILTGTGISFIDHWLTSEKQKIEIQKQKITAERAFLQSQVNPHFIFNTLNNIYSMVYHASEESLSAIKKLSEIIRYTLKERNEDYEDLSEEVNYLKNYIALQRYRTSQPSVVFEQIGETRGIFIPAMLLISFVENAFKHGVLNDPDYPIMIKLKVDAKLLVFNVKNKIDNRLNHRGHGIGLSNVKRRLSLYYEDGYRIENKQEDGIYYSELQINFQR